eukprot:COSAG02_NODE_9004_length_2363_cov_6.127539_1_plen_738_part_01
MASSPPHTAADSFHVLAHQKARKTKRKKRADVIDHEEGTLTAVGAGIVLATFAVLQAEAQLLTLPDPACDMSKINGLFDQVNTACPDYAVALCPPMCALMMAPLAFGECAHTVSGIVDQSEGGAPDGLAQTLQRQLHACVTSNRPTDLAAAASTAQGCPTVGVAEQGGGHRRMDGHLLTPGNVTLGNATATDSSMRGVSGSQRRRTQASDAEVHENEELMAAFAVGDGSVCTLATRLTAAPPSPPPQCENDPDWFRVSRGNNLPCPARDHPWLGYFCGPAGIAMSPWGVPATEACPVSCGTGCADADDCHPTNPCLHGEACTDPPDSSVDPVCACRAPFGGPLCNVDVIALAGALLAFKRSGNGLGLESWTDGGDPCLGGWAGVTCTRNGAMLDLRRTAVTGDLSSLAAMTGMTWLKLGDTAVTGDLRSLAAMTGMTTLSLDRTAVTGDLSSLAAMTGMTQLGLPGTAVTGDLSSLAAMTSMTVLRLVGTAVTGDLRSLAAMTGMTQLWLRDTAVTGDLSSLAAMASMTGMSLGNTAATGDLSSLAAMTSMTWLELYDTAVTGDLRSLAAMTGVTVLLLDGTAVTGDLRSLAAMAGMTQLRLYRTAVTGDLSSLAAMAGMTELHLYDTAVTGDLSSLAAMTSMTQLGLRGTAVTGDLSSLAAMTSMTVLVLGRTAVTGDLSSLAAMTGMTVLSLSGDTAVTGDVSSLAAMTGMTQLWLDGTTVTGWPLRLANGCTFSS